MCRLKPGNSITDDVPAKAFLVDKRQKNTASKLGIVGITLHQCLCIEDDGLLKVATRDIRAYRTEELSLNLG